MSNELKDVLIVKLRRLLRDPTDKNTEKLADDIAMLIREEEYFTYNKVSRMMSREMARMEKEVDDRYKNTEPEEGAG